VERRLDAAHMQAVVRAIAGKDAQVPERLYQVSGTLDSYGVPYICSGGMHRSSPVKQGGTDSLGDVMGGEERALDQRIRNRGC
jgi:hypothetical protein